MWTAGGNRGRSTTLEFGILRQHDSGPQAAQILILPLVSTTVISTSPPFPLFPSVPKSWFSLSRPDVLYGSTRTAQRIPKSVELNEISLAGKRVVIKHMK